MLAAGSLYRRRQLIGAGFVLPTILIISLVLVYPVIESIVISFGKSSISGQIPYTFVGLTNYFRLVHSPNFWNSLEVTVIFTAFSIPLELIFGVGLALLMNEYFRGKSIARLAVLFPWALPTALNALIWRWMFNSDYGVFNSIALQSHMVAHPIDWLGTPALAMTAMIVVSVWKTSSFMALIILAGLQAIPESLYEAGRMDGMTRWTEFTEVTLPLLRAPILVALILRSMDALRTFELPFNLTGGGPINATQSLSLYAYKEIFTYIKFNYGSAVVVAQFAVVFVISLIYIFALRRKD